MFDRTAVQWSLMAVAFSAACLPTFAPATETPAADPGELFTVTAEIVFQTEEVNIPGWEGGPFSEPVGEGSVEIRLAFPEAGGAPTMQAGDARVSRYGCFGSAPCSCTVPEDLLTRQWQPVVLDRVEWNRDSRVITLMGPATYPEDETAVRVRCAPGADVVVPDHPLFKLLGAFGRSNAPRWGSGFEIPLTGPGPWKRVFERELFSDGPKVFRARLEFTVEATPAVGS